MLGNKIAELDPAGIRGGHGSHRDFRCATEKYPITLNHVYMKCMLGLMYTGHRFLL
jgi:hypothetical protein